MKQRLISGLKHIRALSETFLERIGYSPQDDYRHSLHSKKWNKGVISMDLSTLKIRLVCEDDRDALWEIQCDDAASNYGR